jgi:predicted Na+-dependent transporter
MAASDNATSTAAPSSTQPQLSVWVTIFTYLILALVMFGMACTVTKGALKTTIKAKKPFIIALSCQILLMPAYAYLIGKILNLSDLHAMCLLLLGCCPGGSFSNVLCYFAGGNQALSVGLTCITNLFALVTLPLLLLIWGGSFSSAQIPYGDVLLSLSLVFFPALGGIYLRSKSEKYSKYGERVGAVSYFSQFS